MNRFFVPGVGIKRTDSQHTDSSIHPQRTSQVGIDLVKENKNDLEFIKQIKSFLNSTVLIQELHVIPKLQRIYANNEFNKN